MKNFRPNIVVKGLPKGFSEDYWKSFTIGGLKFNSLDIDARCILTTTDQEQGIRRKDKQPLAILHHYRTDGNDVYFGLHLSSSVSEGLLRKGDEVIITEFKPEQPFKHYKEF